MSKEEARSPANRITSSHKGMFWGVQPWHAGIHCTLMAVTSHQSFGRQQHVLPTSRTHLLQRRLLRCCHQAQQLLPRAQQRELAAPGAGSHVCYTLQAAPIPGKAPARDVVQRCVQHLMSGVEAGQGWCGKLTATPHGRCCSGGVATLVMGCV